MMNAKQLLLASQSPRRQALLKRLGYPFSVEVPHLDETTFLPPNRTVWTPSELASQLAALTEAKALAGQLAWQSQQPLDQPLPAVYSLGVDTVIYHQGKLLGKPRDAQQASAYLHQLSNATHEVWTQFTLRGPEGPLVQELVKTAVTFATLPDSWIEAYIQTGAPLDKAGAYGIQDEAGLWIRKLEGDFYAVMGLPLSAVFAALQTHLGPPDRALMRLNEGEETH